MRPVQAGQGWDEPFAMRGLYTTVAGRLSGEPPSRAIAAQSSRAIASQTSRADTAQTLRAVPAHTLLWDAHAGAGVWAFEPQIQVQTQGTGAQAWWLGFTPGS